MCVVWSYLPSTCVCLQICIFISRRCYFIERSPHNIFHIYLSIYLFHCFLSLLFFCYPDQLSHFVFLFSIFTQYNLATPTILSLCLSVCLSISLSLSLFIRRYFSRFFIYFSLSTISFCLSFFFSQYFCFFSLHFYLVNCHRSFTLSFCFSKYLPVATVSLAHPSVYLFLSLSLSLLPSRSPSLSLIHSYTQIRAHTYTF